MKPSSGISLILSFIFFTSCTHYYYLPQESHLLAIEEKKDVKISGGIFTPLENIDGGNIQIGYSPIKHISVQASGLYATSSLGENFRIVRSKGYTTNLALGTYVDLTKKKSDSGERILLDLYGGVSTGKVTNVYSRETNSTFDFERFYGQAGIHFQDSIIGFDLVFQGGMLNYVDGTVFGQPESFQQSILSYIEQNNSTFVGETTLRSFYKLKKGKFYFSLSHLLIKDQVEIANNQFSFRFNHFSNFTTSIGLIYDLNRSNEKTAEESTFSIK
ncbi:MAG: hypothetical protein AAGG68_13360 [Bacteroidota bacterium]